MRLALRAGGGHLRFLSGLVLLALLTAAALLDPALWQIPSGPQGLRAIHTGAAPWVPSAVAALLAGGGAGAWLAGRRSRGSGPAASLDRHIATGGDPLSDSPTPARQGSVVERKRMAWGALGPSLVAGILAAGVAQLVFQGRPVHVDAVVQAFQAHILREGDLTAPAPPLWEFFVTLNTGLRDGRWFGQFPPGYATLLALAGDGVGRIALYGVVTGLGVFGTMRAGTALYGRSTGLLAATLYALSPFTLLLAGTGLNHGAAATAAILAFAAATAAVGAAGARPRAGGRELSLLGCGAALGALVAIRPLDGAVVLTCIVPYVATVGVTRRRLWLLAAGFLPPVVLLLLSNRAATGSPFELAYMQVWGTAHGLGFHTTPWGESHSLARGLQSLHRDLWLLNAQAFGPALPLLPLAAAPLLLAGRVAGSVRPERCRPAHDDSCAAAAPARPDRLEDHARWGASAAGELCLYAVTLAVPAAYVFYWHHDWFLGPRYLFTAFPFFTLLVARGLTLLWDGARGRRRVRGALVGTLAVGGVWLFALELPSRLGSASAVWPASRTDVAREARAQNISQGVVFVKESWGSRLIARLRGRGLSAAEAERLYRSSDHCELHGLLEDPRLARRALLETLAATKRDGYQAPAAMGDAAPNRDPSLRLRPGRRLTGACREEIAYDRAAPYGAFTPQLATLDPGLRDPLIVARDLRRENPRLRAALRREAAYLYVPAADGRAASFLLLAR